MQSDLFRALLDSQNSRRHPILEALLYEFCPAAAHWWLAGVDPVLPDDMVWKMMELRAAGMNLRQVLELVDLGEVAPDVKAYLQEIENFRLVYEMQRLASPELGPYFKSEIKRKNHNFGFREGYVRLGVARGWADVLEFARLWSFVFVDWQLNAHIVYEEGKTDIEFKLVRLAFHPAGIRVPAFFPGWLWKVTTGRITRNVVALPVEAVSEQDQLKAYLIAQSANADEKLPWPSPPEVYAVDRRTGEAEPYRSLFVKHEAAALIQPLAHMAESGPYPPLNAMRHPRSCRSCGFKDQCYQREVLSQFALHALEMGL